MKTSKDFVSRFSAALVRAVNSKKQHTKKLYFRLLSYSTVHDPRGKQTEINVQRFRLNQKEELHKKLFEIKCDGEGDLSWWIMGTFYELFSDIVISRQETSQQNETVTIDQFLSSQEACLVYKYFLKYESCKLHEVTISTLIHLDDL